MPSADRLHEFTRVVAHGSISGAARDLQLPRSTLSRRLSALESELGVRLLHRRTRRLVLTDAGRELHRRALRITSQTQEAWQAVRQLDGTPRGLLRVTVSAGIDPGLFLQFLRDFPEVTVEVRRTTRHVDLIGEGVDVAVRYGAVSDPNLYVRRVTVVRSFVVAAPDYLERHGTPGSPEELEEYPCALGMTGAWAPTRAWPLLRGGKVPVGGRLVCNDANLMHAAAVRGDALALLPQPLVADDLRSGALVAVLADDVGATGPISLVYAERDYLDPKVRAFVDRAVPLLRRALAPAEGVSGANV